MNKYPHWEPIVIEHSRTICVSEEGYDGVPDYVIIRETTGRVMMKCRTSVHWQDYSSVKDAKAAAGQCPLKTYRDGQREDAERWKTLETKSGLAITALTLLVNRMTRGSGMSSGRFFVDIGEGYYQQLDEMLMTWKAEDERGS